MTHGGSTTPKSPSFPDETKSLETNFCLKVLLTKNRYVIPSNIGKHLDDLGQKTMDLLLLVAFQSGKGLFIEGVPYTAINLTEQRL